MTYLPLALRVLLTLVFVGAGGAKLLGAEMMFATFEQIGLGQGFRYVTGTMVGAVLTHLHIIGPSALPAIILGLRSKSLFPNTSPSVRWTTLQT